MTPRSSAPVESRVRGNAHARFGGRAGETDSPQGGHRAPARPYTHQWMNGYGKLRRCTEKCQGVVDFYLFLAAALVVLRQLIQRARLRYRWPTRPTSRRLK